MRTGICIAFFGSASIFASFPVGAQSEPGSPAQSPLRATPLSAPTVPSSAALPAAAPVSELAPAPQPGAAPYTFGFGDEQPKPPPIHVDYGVYGIGVTADVLADAGATCQAGTAPCILGSGGGLVLRGGYRSPGPWYIGGAYQFSKTDSSNLYNLAILQQLRAEMRYMLDMGSRTAPFATWGIGGVVYGNEWGVETGGGTLFGGVGFETELSRLALLGLTVVYQPVLLAGFTDTAKFNRTLGLAQFVRVEVQFEIRSELPRHR